ncbi:FxsA family protein [Methyloferula stellata]|uniref:FxsA family protein n=1 Tax=Methyloferula stellata TaxID=876270 RepID=UPI000360FBE2|nr:FxsA family protein [Methyloferula stellata]
MQITHGPVELPKRLLLGFALWFAAELCAFALVVAYIGLAGALLLGLLTSLMGFSLLRRLGQDAASSLRQVLGTQGVVLKPESMVDGTISAIAGVLLILPGFLSDLVGLALSAPMIRLWLANRMHWQGASFTAQSQPRRRDEVIDLTDGEWRRLDDSAPNPRGQS